MTGRYSTLDDAVCDVRGLLGHGESGDGFANVLFDDTVLDALGEKLRRVDRQGRARECFASPEPGEKPRLDGLAVGRAERADMDGGFERVVEGGPEGILGEAVGETHGSVEQGRKRVLHGVSPLRSAGSGASLPARAGEVKRGA